MTITLTTRRLLLRPLVMADAAVIENLIFADAEVAKWLAHDVSVPGNARKFARGWCNHLGCDGNNDIWSRGGYGAFAITDRNGAFGDSGNILGIVGFYGAEKIGGKWHGELFNALGSAYQGHGVMSEACERVMAAYRELPDAGDLYAVYWHTLNHVSGHILRKLGFIEDGPRSVVEEYGKRDVRSFLRFELWRIDSAGDDDFKRVAHEAATKIGHLAHDGVINPADALTSIRRMIIQRDCGYLPDDSIEAAFATGLQGEGLLHLQYSMAA